MPPPPRKLHLVAFSKDRAFQCTALLHSLDLYLSPAPASLTVLYTASSPFFLEGYRELEAARREGCRGKEGEEGRNDSPNGRRKEENDHSVIGSSTSSPLCIPTTFVHEDTLGGFAPALASVMDGWKKEGTEGGREEGEEEAYVMWLVDDLLFHASFDATPFLALLSSTRGKDGGRDGGREGGKEEEDVWAIHPKLHPGISYSHTLDKVKKEDGGGREGGKEGRWEGRKKASTGLASLSPLPLSLPSSSPPLIFPGLVSTLPPLPPLSRHERLSLYA